jgi:hypothetical protein
MIKYWQDWANYLLGLVLGSPGFVEQPVNLQQRKVFADIQTLPVSVTNGHSIT